MGLVASGLGPADQQAITQLGPEIIRTLRRASAEIEQHRGRTETTRWFGDTSRAWMIRLQRALNKMASIINLESIEVSFASIHERESGTFAAALRPTGGWNTYTDLSRARNQNFRIELDRDWNGATFYRTPRNQPGDSKFQSLVHELTHLILGTDDVEVGGVEAYGTDDARDLAQNNPAEAKRNADNWGYFIEEFR